MRSSSLFSCGVSCVPAVVVNLNTPMRKEDASSKQSVRFVACKLLESLQHSRVDRLCAKLSGEFVIINSHLFAVDDSAFYIPRRDFLL